MVDQVGPTANRDHGREVERPATRAPTSWRARDPAALPAFITLSKRRVEGIDLRPPRMADAATAGRRKRHDPPIAAPKLERQFFTRCSSSRREP